MVRFGGAARLCGLCYGAAMIRQLDENILVSGQVAPQTVAGIAAEGVTVLVNNRPDGEDAGQPLSTDVEEAARAAGIRYHHVPIIRGIGPADVEAMQQALKDAEGGKLLAFCRSGMRSALAIALAKRANGASAEEVSQQLIDAGFDPSPIAHLL
jgi:uncharacterized protein (TIGR01244 family)